MFLDMGYAVRKVYHEEFADERTLQSYAFIPGPSFFEEYGATVYTHANHYAALLEIDYFMNLKHIFQSPDKFRMEYPNLYDNRADKERPHPAFKSKPFDYIFTLDTQSQKGAIELDEYHEMIGAFIANLYSGELAESYYDINSNSSPELTKYSIKTNRPTCYSSFGMGSIFFPRNIIIQRLSQYFAIQLVADLIHTKVSEKKMETEVRVAKDPFNFNKDNNIYSTIMENINLRLKGIIENSKIALNNNLDIRDNLVHTEKKRQTQFTKQNIRIQL